MKLLEPTLETTLLDLLHDLNNVLMLVASDDREKREHAAELAMSITRNMGEVLLRQQTVKPLSPVRLCQRFADFERTKARLESTFGVRLHLTHNVTDDCYVVSDIELARKVTRNLIANAANANASTVRIHYEEGPSVVEIVFSDDGDGMNHETLARLNGPRSGVHGVSIVRQLVMAAGGTAHWESRVSVGTWVTLGLLKTSTQGRTEFLHVV